MKETAQFIRGVARMLGFRGAGRDVQVALRIPPSAR